MGSSSSRRWANAISSFASRIYFLLIIFQVPLFRVPCRTGICVTPIHVTSSQLIASEILPVDFVKILLYPGALVNALIKGDSFPKYGDLLELYNLSNVKNSPGYIDLKHLEILAGSYFSVTGALLGLLKPGRLSLFGMLLLLWGLVKELIRQRTNYLDANGTVQVSPIMLVALVTALSSIKCDVRQIIRSFQAHRTAIAVLQRDELLRRRRKEREMKRLEWTVNYGDNGTRRSTKAAQVAQEGTKISQLRTVTFEGI